jgi:hypothetical protein
VHAGQDVQQGRLANAVRPDEADPRALRDAAREPSKDVDCAKGLA